MTRSSYPVYVTADRRRDREDRGRGRTSGRERDAVDHVYDRDKGPRPVFKHRETSRDGRRRHEYRYYSPPRSSGYPRSRSEERTSPGVVKEVAHTSARRREGGRRRNDDEVDKHRSSRRTSTHDDRKHDRRRDDYDDGKDGDDQVRSKRKTAAQHAGKSALTAGAIEAIKSRGHGGGSGETLKRVATAALGAAAIDAAASKVRHKDPRDKGKGSMLGASLGGLVVDSLVQKLR